MAEADYIAMRKDAEATALLRRHFSTADVHALASRLCFEHHGDWRYDPGRKKHMKRWYAQAERCLRGVARSREARALADAQAAALTPVSQ